MEKEQLENWIAKLLEIRKGIQGVPLNNWMPFKDLKWNQFIV